MRRRVPGRLALLLCVPWLAALVLLGLSACGGSGTAPSPPLPTIAILNPTSAASYATTSSSVRIGGSIGGASYVHVRNSSTGASTEGYVFYLNGQGSWYADVTGLQPGNNVLVATADADGTGVSTASGTLTVSRPTQPAQEILNGTSAATATGYWVDMNSVNTSHQLALYGDGTGRATTGNVLTEIAGAPVSMRWAYDGVDAIIVSGCASCSYQRISRIAGSAAEGAFYGQIETVGGAGETALHYFQWVAGSF